MKAIAFTAALVAASLTLATARADSPISIAHPWLRATPKSAPVVGGYATITNHGTAPDILVSASIPVAPEGQIHAMTMTNGVMEMHRLTEGLAIAPGATVTLEPGGNHMMFQKPTAQVKEGDRMQGSLTFKNAGTIPVTFAVGGMAAKAAPGTKPAGGMSGMEHMQMDHMPMDHMH